MYKAVDSPFKVRLAAILSLSRSASQSSAWRQGEGERKREVERVGDEIKRWRSGRRSGKKKEEQADAV